MGFLHEGHVSLMREGARRADDVAVSIFLNPAQFGPTEDLSKYPKDLSGDLAKCASAGVTLVYAPEPSDVYPSGFQTHVEVERVSQGLCGARRPGHFRGVATVVAKLLALFRPTCALFGEKDYQQLQVIRALEADLDLGVDIVGLPTIRDAEGLALSSRNSYLKGADRERSLSLIRGLRAAQALAESGEVRAGVLEDAVRTQLKAQEVREDYVQVVDAKTLSPVTVLSPSTPARILVAAYVGSTRLIDNVALP